MKKIFSTLLIATALVGTLSISSCTKTCDAGYEGSDCKTEVRTKYVATYKVSGTATNTNGSAPITDLLVAVTSASSGVQDLNFTYTLSGTTYSLKGTLQADGTSLNFATQTTNSLSYSGSGSFAGTTLNLNLTEAGSVTTTITLSGPKQ
jgi:hypothetical protein